MWVGKLGSPARWGRRRWGYTEACHCYTGVVDYDVYPIWVLLLQEGSEVCDALRLGDVEAMVFNCC